MYSYNNIPYTTQYEVRDYSGKNINPSTYQSVSTNKSDDRFIGPFLGPLLLGGIAGYTLRPPYPAPYPVPIYPMQQPVTYIPYNEPSQIYTSNSYYY